MKIQASVAKTVVQGLSGVHATAVQHHRGRKHLYIRFDDDPKQGRRTATIPAEDDGKIYAERISDALMRKLPGSFAAVRFLEAVRNAR